MAGVGRRKQSLYLTEEIVAELEAEAQRQDRSMSWLMQQAWRIARVELLRIPDAPGFEPVEDEMTMLRRAGCDSRGRP